jgi:hypothetical protein
MRLSSKRPLRRGGRSSRSLVTPPTNLSLAYCGVVSCLLTVLAGTLEQELRKEEARLKKEEAKRQLAARKLAARKARVTVLTLDRPQPPNPKSTTLSLNP